MKAGMKNDEIAYISMIAGLFIERYCPLQRNEKEDICRNEHKRIDGHPKNIYIMVVEKSSAMHCSYLWRRIEAVITGRTRNAFALRGTRVRIPPSPLEKVLSQ